MIVKKPSYSENAHCDLQFNNQVDSTNIQVTDRSILFLRRHLWHQLCIPALTYNNMKSLQEGLLRDHTTNICQMSINNHVVACKVARVSLYTLLYIRSVSVQCCVKGPLKRASNESQKCVTRKLVHNQNTLRRVVLLIYHSKNILNSYQIQFQVPQSLQPWLTSETFSNKNKIIKRKASIDLATFRG